MEPFKSRGNKKLGPEAKIQDAIEKYLKMRDWIVKSTHGNEFQWGFADVYAAHKKYGTRWIEIKNPDAYSFTAAQLEWFPLLESVGVGTWILVAATDTEYKKLFEPPNWRYYWMIKQLNMNH